MVEGSGNLADLYGVTTKRLNEQVKRNSERFPPDFLFQLTEGEDASLRSRFATFKTGRGQHRKYLPYAFTASVSAGIELGTKRAAFRERLPVFPPAGTASRR